MRTKNQLSGQSIIEIAMLLPVLLFLILGFFDLGRAVLFISTLNSAAREGTRWVIVQDRNFGANNEECKVYDNNGIYLYNLPNADCVCKYVRSEGFFTLQALVGAVDVAHPESFCIAPSGAIINPVFVYPSGPTDTTEANITITITYNFIPITPGIKELLGSGGGIPIRAESNMLLAPVAR